MEDFLDRETFYIVKENEKYAVFCQGKPTSDQLFDTLEAARSHIASLEAGITFAEFVRAGVGS